jgi:hypothetical protein
LAVLLAPRSRAAPQRWRKDKINGFGSRGPDHRAPRALRGAGRDKYLGADRDALSVGALSGCGGIFGTGFPSKEAEMVVSHPVRRKIILYLIVAGKIGLTSAMATLIVPFVQRDEQSILQNAGFILILILSALALGLLFQLPFSKKPLELLQRRLLEGAGNLRAVDYEVLLKVKHGFCVSDLEI